MTMQTVEVDFGARKIPIAVPADATIAEFQDPTPLRDPEAAILAAIADPVASPPLEALVEAGNDRCNWP